MCVAAGMSPGLIGTDAALFTMVGGPCASGAHFFFAAFVYRDSSGWHSRNSIGTQGIGYPLPGSVVPLRLPDGCLNVRDGPSLSAQVVTCLSPGKLIMTTGTPTYRDGHIWWMVRGGFPPGAVGTMDTGGRDLGWADHDLLFGLADQPFATQLEPFVGRWYGHARELIVGADGRATYQGRTFRWCGPGVPPPCDTPGGSPVGGLSEQLVFTTVIFSTAYGSIASGTDDYSVLATGPVTLKVGSSITLTPYANGKVAMSDGWILCGPTTPPSDPDCSSA